MSSPRTSWKVVEPLKVRAKLVILPDADSPGTVPVQIQIPRKEPNKKPRKGFWESINSRVGKAGRRKGGES